jgi:methionyl-tRNA formyltransferase
MKIIICLSKNIYSAKALNLLLPYLRKHQVKIVLSPTSSIDSGTKYLVELKRFERLRLINFFQTLDHQASSSNQKFLTFNQIAQFFNGEVMSYSDINSSEAINDFKEFAPDLVISIRFGQIFKEEIIAIPKHGIINLHSGILPNFRGVMPSFWAILNGEKFLGTTLHYIDNGKIDVGDIIDFTRMEVDFDRSLAWNINRLYDEGCELILKCLEKIESGVRLSVTKQDEIGVGSYFSYPKEEQMLELMKKIELFDERDGEIFERW